MQEPEKTISQEMGKATCRESKEKRNRMSKRKELGVRGAYKSVHYHQRYYHSGIIAWIIH